ncbi:MAG: helix-turn-helix transcriptional regulator [Sphingomonadales bacterium]|nr:helix-turn-helix transcriptional regulator [Sphingomonadales bacterium]MBD3771964.1 helix-turn-helix transcriptional regulator [Paracoccaceae bacterium]
MGSIVQLGASPGDSGPAKGDPVALYGAAFVCASLAFCLNSLLASRLGAVGSLLAVIGNATCGWSWLATRALFRREEGRHALWPLGAVLLVMAASAAGSFVSMDDMPRRMLDNLASLGSSAMLLLAVAEPLLDLKAQTDPAERQFRIIYAAAYLAILGIGVLAVDGAPPESIAARLSLPVKVACVFIAIGGYGLALSHRKQHPLQARANKPSRKPAAADFALGEQVTRLLCENQLYTEADLRVADLAKLTGEPEYKVTQCITGALGFANFNQMVNSYRIAEAKRRLRDPDHAHLPILTIALDCGFGSIGPFNRAFKADTGMTPQIYRRQ